MNKLKTKRESTQRTKELELVLLEMKKDSDWVKTQELLKFKESLKG